MFRYRALYHQLLETVSDHSSTHTRLVLSVTFCVLSVLAFLDGPFRVLSERAQATNARPTLGLWAQAQGHSAVRARHGTARRFGRCTWTSFAVVGLLERWAACCPSGLCLTLYSHGRRCLRAARLWLISVFLFFFGDVTRGDSDLALCFETK